MYLCHVEMLKILKRDFNLSDNVIAELCSISVGSVKQNLLNKNRENPISEANRRIIAKYLDLEPQIWDVKVTDEKQFRSFIQSHNKSGFRDVIKCLNAKYLEISKRARTLTSPDKNDPSPVYLVDHDSEALRLLNDSAHIRNALYTLLKVKHR